MVIAIDVAILPPPDVSAQAIALSAALPARHSKGLRLDATHLPHVTLTQQFVPRDTLAKIEVVVGSVLEGRPPLALRVTGGDKGSSSVWMGLERTPALRELHGALMRVLQPFEVPDGDAAAFVDGDARPGDVMWVSGFRAASSGDAFRPHITLGHAARPPRIAPFDFTADRVALCQLGRFCTCRHVLAQWRLVSSPRETRKP